MADLTIEDALAWPGDYGVGLRNVCIREVQKSLKESAKRLIEDKMAAHEIGEAQGFKIFKDVVETPKDGLIIFQGMQDHTAESIKSLEGYHRAWVEEAQTLSARSLQLLRPTIRAEASELRFTYNPRRKSDPVDVLAVQDTPKDAIIVHANWSDNPWFPGVLELERLEDLEKRPDSYDHVWEGGYATVTEGAYYARSLAEARAEGRIGNVARDPVSQIRAFWDIGVRDATAIWIAQFVGQRINVLDYYEAIGQPLGTHLDWLRQYGKPLCYMPHDAAKMDAVTAVRFEDHVRQGGFEVITVPNQGRGAAMKRVEAGRRLFPRIWFNEDTTEPGRDALGWYHEKRDEDRQVGLGPEHDWSSHGADAFGLMCVAHEDELETGPQYEDDYRERTRSGVTGY